MGAISLAVLAIAIWARYGGRLAGASRWVYVVTAAMALYLDCFVAVVQSFLKIPALHALAPTGSEPPFVVAQSVVLAIFIWLTWPAAKRFHVVLGTLHLGRRRTRLATCKMRARSEGSSELWRRDS